MSLTVVFRRSGWQWPLGAGDAIRVYAPTGQLWAELSGPLIAALLEHQLTGWAVLAQVGAAATAGDRPRLPVTPPPQISPRRPTAGANRPTLRRRYRNADA